MKSLNPVTLSPVVQLGNLVGRILDHSQRMDQISKEYKLTKRKMIQEHQLQMQRLNNEMSYFREMAQLQAQQFEYTHHERMQVTEVMNNVSIGMREAKNAQIIHALQEAMGMLLEQLSHSRETHINFLEYNGVSMIGGR